VREGIPESSIPDFIETAVTKGKVSAIKA